MNEKGYATEAAATSAIKRYLDGRMRQGDALWHYKAWGSHMAKAGVPDRPVCYRGISVWLEVKSETGRATPKQMYEIEKIRCAGGVAEVVRTPEDVAKLLGLIDVSLRENWTGGDRVHTSFQGWLERR